MAIHAGRYPEARAPYEEAIGLLDPPESERDRTGPQAPAAAEAPADAAGLRDLAFSHLVRAIELGACDAAQLEEDADLAPLHADARWAAALEAGRK